MIDGKDVETAHAAPYFIQKNIALLYEQIMYFKKISRYMCVPTQSRGELKFYAYQAEIKECCGMPSPAPTIRLIGLFRVLPVGPNLKLLVRICTSG